MQRPLHAFTLAQQPRTSSLSVLAVAVLLAVAGCGGGGGSGTGSTSGATEQPTGNTGGGSTGGTATTAPALTLGNDSFLFAPDASTTRASLDSVGGGTALFARWDPNNPQTALKPGMKVMFFGAAQGCASGTEGPVTALSDSVLNSTAALTGMSATATAGMHWTPSGAVAGCADSAQTQAGASSVFVNAAASAGGVAMLTTSGVQTNGSTPFLGPYGAAGQDGNGANSGILGTFVNFRQVWSASDPVQPWTGTAAARLRSMQSVGSVQTNAGAGETTQAKQQMMATFLNLACVSEVKANGKPCQIQYLLNTSIVRSGVSDWSTVGWFQNGGLTFDPAQGSIPVIDGPIKTAGTQTVDQETGLALFTSQGLATQHGTFANQAFDVTISFDQLMNVVRMVTAKANGVNVSAVTDAQLATEWGSGWQNRSQWILLSADVGQEVYNPNNTRRVEIGGGFSQLFVGTQP